MPLVLPKDFPNFIQTLNRSFTQLPARKNKQVLHSFRRRAAPVYLILFLLVSFTTDWLPLPYAPNQLDLAQLYLPPFQSTAHWLGTDQLGRDVLVNLLAGCRTALLVSLPAMIVAFTIGLTLGGVAGFLGDRQVYVKRATIWAFPLPLGLGYFYGFHVRQSALREAFQSGTGTGLLAFTGSVLIFLLITGLLTLLIQQILRRWPLLRKDISLPVDQLVLKLIEVLTSIPNLIWILLLASIARPSLLLLVLLIGGTYWTEPARLVRAEMLRIRQMPYVESARALGAKRRYLLLRHALPNALPPLLVAFTFGVARLMALESTLSFLGIGVPPDMPSWGRLVNGMRLNLEAWWLVVFPGLLLVCTVIALQSLAGQWLRRTSRSV